MKNPLEGEFNLFGLTGSWWQSRTIWAALLTFVFQQASQIWPDNSWVPIARDFWAILVVVFLRLGVLNDRDAAIEAQASKIARVEGSN